MPKMNLMEFVRTVVDQVGNDNISNAAASIKELPKTHAMAAVAYACDQLHGEPKYSAFLRCLESLI
jgi:hypothetical protein